jgi:hypothetical protein
LDFVHDQLADGRLLTVVHQWGRLSPVLSPARSISGADVVRVLEQAVRTAPDRRRSRDRSHLSCLGGPGLRAWHAAGFYAAGYAHG